MDRRAFPTGDAIVIAVVLVLATSARADPQNEPKAELRAAESAFAATMADRDHAAFVSFLDDEATFVGSDRIHRGKQAVAEAWKGLFDGPAAPFSWKPETVEVLASGKLGFTSGPVISPDGNRIGSFNSVWRKNSDGKWKVVFDKGCP